MVGLLLIQVNNTEVVLESLSAQDKIKIVLEKQPDLAGSIIQLDKEATEQRMMYPFALILNGTLIASYDRDSSTITKGDARYKKYKGMGQTLQEDPVSEFKRVAQESNGKEHNESIVFKPMIKGILIDGERLEPVANTVDNGATKHDYYKDSVTEYYEPEQEEEIMKRYGESVNTKVKGTPTKGPFAGKEVLR